MYLHIGAEKTILLRDLVAVLNLESFSQYDELFNIWRQHAVFLSKETPKSLIIVQKDGNTQSYLSPVSAATIYKRAEAPFEIQKENLYVNGL